VPEVYILHLNIGFKVKVYGRELGILFKEETWIMFNDMVYGQDMCVSFMVMLIV
jgi:hypothetical protein